MTAIGYATGIAPRAAARERPYRVVWLGERPWWLDTSGARDEIDDVEPGSPSRLGSLPLVVHATASALPTLQRASRDRLVADLCGAKRLDRAGARVARAASVVLVDDPARLRLLGRGSSPTWSLLRPPLDLAEHAPLSLLRERRDPELKRFRRLHRVSPHTILYVGPYRRGDGWLHLVLEAAMALRERYDDLVVAALPDGPVDRRYRDACERQAMPLGHRAIVEWQSPPEERALWYALASVVCAGAPRAGRPPPRPPARAYRSSPATSGRCASSRRASRGRSYPSATCGPSPPGSSTCSSTRSAPRPPAGGSPARREAAGARRRSPSLRSCGRDWHRQGDPSWYARNPRASGRALRSRGRPMR